MSRTQLDQFIDDDEEETCPLCVEEFDLGDKNFRPCPCGYQICQFCYNNIKNNMNGTCPACRRVYDDKTLQWTQVSAEEWANFRAEKARKEKRNQAARQKEAQKREADHLGRKHLAGLRVMQKNLVYVTGLQPATREDKLLETLRGHDYFGQYGKIVKIVVSKAKDTSHHQQQSVGVYVTFARKEDAENCIAAVNGSVNGSRTLRAQYGTTKYCSAYLRNEICNNKNCMFLHEPGEDQESFTRQDLSSMNVISTQHPGQSESGQQASRQAPPVQQAPVAAATTQMQRQESSEGSSSPRPDAPALPSTANWANKPSNLPQRDRQASRVATSSEASPAISASTPARPEEDSRPDSTVPSEAPRQQTEAETSISISEHTAKSRESGQSVMGDLDRAFRIVCTADLGFKFDESMLSEEELKAIKSFPLLIDPSGGAKRQDLLQRQKQEAAERGIPASAQGIAPPLAGPPGLTPLDADELPDAVSGSLQLGGEPEERFDGSFGGNQHAIGRPSQQSGIGLDHNYGASEDFRRGAGDINMAQQEQNLLQQFKNTTSAGSLLSGFQGGHQPQNLQAGPGGNASHVRQTSKFSFANDSGTASTSVKPVANQKYLNQQNSMMPQGNNHFNQNTLQQGAHGGSFYSGTSNISGPPPGLKTTGTPPVSGGGMFAHGNGFATSGIGYGANALGRTPDNDMYRQLLLSQGRRDGQGSDAGKRESMFPSFLQHHSSSSSTPAPAPGILNFPHGPQPGAFQDSGAQKQKKKGKKHRHANTSSSGGGGIVNDVADPSILHTRLQHMGGSMGGPGVFGSQGQGGFANTFNGAGGYGRQASGW